MSDKILSEILNVLNDIHSSLPNEANLYDLERSVEKISDFIDSQNTILERIESRIDDIYDKVPSNDVSTGYIEKKLETIATKLDDINSNVVYLQ